MPPPDTTDPPIATAPPSDLNDGLLTGERLCRMAVRCSLFSQVLDYGDAPMGILKYLTKKWAVPEAYMRFTRSPLPQNNGFLPLPFFDGNYPNCSPG